jgi:Glu-tRNA(Gln) amidotransferase subunit E-like FAD-binding protein
VSMNYAIFYKENDIPKVTFQDSLQDTENIISELKSQKVKCYYIEFDFEQLVHFSSVVQLVDRSEYDYTRDLFGEL